MIINNPGKRKIYACVCAYVRACVCENAPRKRVRREDGAIRKNLNMHFTSFFSTKKSSVYFYKYYTFYTTLKSTLHDSFVNYPFQDQIIRSK